MSIGHAQPQEHRGQQTALSLCRSGLRYNNRNIMLCALCKSVTWALTNTPSRSKLHQQLAHMTLLTLSCNCVLCAQAGLRYVHAFVSHIAVPSISGPPQYKHPTPKHPYTLTDMQVMAMCEELQTFQTLPTAGCVLLHSYLPTQ